MLIANTRQETHVEDDDGVRGLEVDAETTSTRREQEHEVIASGRVEVRDALFTHVGRDHAVEALVDVATERKVVRQYVQHANHLREDEDAVAVLT